MDNMRRVTVQLSGKMIGNTQLQPGVYDLLQKVRGKGKEPITSNLPSENYSLGIGSKRLVGTGRTAGIRARKLEQEGMAESAMAARNYLVGGGKRSAEGSDLTFLKNAMGNEIAFSVEKGGGARANLLATKTRRRRKLMDAAATRVGGSIPLDMRVKEKEKRQMQEEQKNAENGNKKQKTTHGTPSTIPLTFLNNNIGRQALDKEMERLRQQDMEPESDPEDEVADKKAGMVVLNEIEDTPILWEEETRKAAFQALYSKEMIRQREILGDNPAIPSPQRSIADADE